MPAAGDAYLLRWILHDYDDAQDRRILRNCRAAMPPDGRLLVVEQIVPVGDAPASWVPKFLDLQMLLNSGGQERTEAEFRALFAAAGLVVTSIIPTSSPDFIVEGIRR